MLVVFIIISLCFGEARCTLELSGILKAFHALEWLDIHIYISRLHGRRISIRGRVMLCAFKVTPHLRGDCNIP